MKGMTNDDLKEAIGVMVGKISKSMEGVRDAVHEFDTLCEIVVGSWYSVYLSWVHFDDYPLRERASHVARFLAGMLARTGEDR